MIIMGIFKTRERTIFLFLISICYFGSNNIFISGVTGNLAKKVYGGYDVEIDKHPQIVSIQFRNQHICGGAIISNRHVLTSASCVLADLHVVYGNIKILSGTNDLMYDYESMFAKFYEVAYVIFHHDYNPRNAWKNDIAILKIASNILFNTMSSSASLSTRSSSTGLIVLGWSINPFTKIMTRYLQILNVHTMDHYSCNRKYFHFGYLHKHQHCLVLPETAQITQGDGGSSVVRGRTVVGIISSVSWNSHDPTVYTRVFGYHSWIEEMKLEI